MKRFLSLLLFLCMLAAAPLSMAENGFAEIPQLLRFTQTAPSYQWLNDRLYTITMYPHTANSAVDAEMKSLIDAMDAEGRKHLPSTIGDEWNSHLITASTISRTGTQIMSFLTTASVTHTNRQIYIDYATRVYDMASGAELRMTDLFPEDSPAWSMLADEVRMQLSMYFAGVTPDQDALDALCSREGLENASFTLTPASMLMTYRADTLYPGREQLMHVRIYYPDIRPYMTQFMYEQTDNSRYQLVALTYDDGCAKGNSTAVVNQLRRYGASATFFVVGTTIAGNQDILAYEHDSGFSVASHNYEHAYKNLTTANILNWKKLYDEAMNNAIGIRPTIMRAPGGNDKPFCTAQVGLPVIHWSLSPGDAGAGADKIDSIASRVGYGSNAGDVVLMHDLNTNCRSYTAQLLPLLEQRGIMCVTVEELFSHYGVRLKANTAYNGCAGLPIP